MGTDVNVSDESKKAQSDRDVHVSANADVNTNTNADTGGDDDASKKPTHIPAKKSSLGTATIHQNSQQQNPTIPVQPNASRYQQQQQQFGRYPPYPFTANAPMGMRMGMGMNNMDMNKMGMNIGMNMAMSMGMGTRMMRPNAMGYHPPYPPQPFRGNPPQRWMYNNNNNNNNNNLSAMMPQAQPPSQVRKAVQPPKSNGKLLVDEVKAKGMGKEKEKEKEIQELKIKLSDAIKKADGLERQVRKQARDIDKLNADIQTYKNQIQIKNEAAAVINQNSKNKGKGNGNNKGSSTDDLLENLQSKIETEISKRKGNEEKYKSHVEKLKKTHKEQLERVKKKAAEKLELAKSKSKQSLEKEKCKRKVLEAEVPPSMRKKLKIAMNSTHEANPSITPTKKYPIGNKWMTRFERLKSFKEEFGHCDVPMSYGKAKKNNGGDSTAVPDPDDEEKRKLVHFVSDQRTFHRKMRQGRVDHSITPEKIQLLEGIGFKWERGVIQLPWEDRMKQLIEFKAEHGHCEVSSTFKRKGYEGFPAWVQMQRRKYREGSLKPERLTKLEEVGFKWSLRDRGGTLEERMIRGGVLPRRIVDSNHDDHDNNHDNGNGNGNDDGNDHDGARNDCDVVADLVLF